jgi:hypothetical protein
MGYTKHMRTKATFVNPKHGQKVFKPHAMTRLKLAHVEEYVEVRGAHLFELVDVPVLVECHVEVDVALPIFIHVEVAVVQVQ